MTLFCGTERVYTLFCEVELFRTAGAGYIMGDDAIAAAGWWCTSGSKAGPNGIIAGGSA